MAGYGTTYPFVVSHPRIEERVQQQFVYVNRVGGGELLVKNLVGRYFHFTFTIIA